MNLSLLDPFQRQIPDRIDATLQLPAHLHFRTPVPVNEIPGAPLYGSPTSAAVVDSEWKAVYHVAYNRRGTYLAAGYGSGCVGVHNLLSRTLSALYRQEVLDQDD